MLVFDRSLTLLVCRQRHHLSNQNLLSISPSLEREVTPSLTKEMFEKICLFSFLIYSKIPQNMHQNTGDPLMLFLLCQYWIIRHILYITFDIQNHLIYTSMSITISPRNRTIQFPDCSF